MQITEILKYIEANTNSAFFYTPNIYKEGKSYLFKKPFKILIVKTQEEVENVLIQVDELSEKPNIIGFALIPYEIGYYFQPKEIKNSYLERSELIIYVYNKDKVEIFDNKNLKYDGIERYFSSENSISNFKLEISKDEYVEKIERIKKYIKDGDTYQINFTTKGKFDFAGKIPPLFLNAIFNQSAKYSAVINAENNFILSFSPELFFKTNYKTIISKPMKGTLKRIPNPEEDKKLVNSILDDKKNLAENVMIVDLLRNDIGRIAEVNSVKVDKLYEVEKYETLYQLTSTISGTLKKNKLGDIIKNLFPSGSITGAPKIKSMQIIAELEKSPRNLYTGSIGFFTNKEATFNIPIRTISIDKKTHHGEIGLGSGIVWDSNAEQEFEEVLLKGKFITEQKQYFELLETILWENENYFLLDYHLKRFKKSAEYFLFKFDKKKILSELKSITANFKEKEKYKIRLLLNKWGNIKIEFSKIENATQVIKIKLSRKKRSNDDKFLYHKTTFRPWDEELKSARQNGYAEVLFINDNDELLEGAISNLLIEKNGKLYTPPIDLEILNGCYRQYLIDNNLCEEKLLTVNDLKSADQIYLCNSIRKKMNITEISS